MSKLLRKTISYHDYGEDYYHAFLAGIFAGAGYQAESNKEHGKGRSDIIIKDYAKDRIAVFEAKYSKMQINCKKTVKKHWYKSTSGCMPKNSQMNMKR